LKNDLIPFENNNNNEINYNHFLRKNTKINKRLNKIIINENDKTKEIDQYDKNANLLSDNLFSFSYKNNITYANNIVSLNLFI